MTACNVGQLGDVATFIRGITYKPTDVRSDGNADAIACMRTKNIQADLEDDDLVFISKALAKAEKILRNGDILVSSANSWNLVGKCSWVPELPYTATFGGFTSVLRADPKQVHPRYLYRWFATERVQRLARSFGQQTTNISNLNHSRCLDLEIPLPPLNEQRRIAAILDKADALRRKRKRALDLLSELSEALFRDTFLVAEEGSWPTVAVGNLAEDMRTGPFGSQLLHSEFVSEGISVIGIDNAVSNEFRWAERRFITEEKFEKLRRYQVYPGDLIITIMGTCGRCAIIPEDVPVSINTKHLCCITLDKTRCLPEFLHAAFLCHPDIKSQLGVQAKGAVMPGLNMGIIKSLALRLPPLQLQRQFLEKREMAAVQSVMAEASEAHCAELFSSLQHRAFTGQL